MEHDIALSAVCLQNLQTSLKVQPIKVNKALKSLGKKLEISNLA